MTSEVQTPTLAYAHNHTVIDDLRFLEAWDRGQVSGLGAILRVRQLHRANPDLAPKPPAKPAPPRPPARRRKPSLNPEQATASR